ncbi:MAG: hypothetical protein J6X18_05615 [Bacteroidales bacterium]|nr:hypothetical protein [Bacteroidales bacterium]
MAIRETDASIKISDRLVKYYQTPTFSNNSILNDVSSGYDRLSGTEKQEYQENQTKAKNDILMTEAFLNDGLSELGGKIVPYDAEIEYLESDGTQYIDTGIVINGYTTNVKVELDFKNNETASAVKVMWGFMGSGNLPRWGNFIYSAYFYASANSTTSTSVVQDTSRHVISSILHYDNGVKVWSAYVDGIVRNLNVNISSPNTLSSNTLPIFLFARNNYGTAGNFISAKIYRFSVEIDGQQIANLIPVRVGSVGYMYDTVSGQFFGNDGTGDFILGPDIT